MNGQSDRPTVTPPVSPTPPPSLAPFPIAPVPVTVQTTTTQTTTPVTPPHTTTDPTEVLLPKTTAQEDINSANERLITLIKEITQAVITVILIVAAAIISVNDGLFETNPAHPFPTTLASVLFLIVGYYYQSSKKS